MGSLEDAFRELSRSGSVESALHSILRDLCETADSSAGLVTGEGWTSPAAPRVSYGSADEIERLSRACARGGPDAEPTALDRAVPLLLCGRRLGTLWLAEGSGAEWSPDLHAEIEVRTTALATLMAAADCVTTDPTQNVLGSSHFRVQLARETARSGRHRLEFSLVLAGAAGPTRRSRDPEVLPSCSPLPALGAWLARRLRGNDVVGLISPQLLGILLPETGRAGARIAVHRIEQLLPDFAAQTEYASFSPQRCRLVSRCYPRDAEDADALLAMALDALSEDDDARHATPSEQPVAVGGEG